MSNPILIVCGSRRWADYPRLACTLDNLCQLAGEPYAACWCGGAAGASAMAETWAVNRWRPLPVRRWPANWRRYGRGAGIRRSAEMIGAAPEGSVLAAFVPHRLADSVGTAHEVRLARRRELAVVVVDCCGLQVLPADPLLPEMEALL